MRTFYKFGAIVAIATSVPAFAEEVQAAAPVAAEASALQVRKGESIYTADGKRVGKVYQISRTGDPQLIDNLRLLTVSAGTLSRVEGKLTTSLSRKEIK